MATVMRLDDRDIELITSRVVRGIEDSRPRLADELAKRLVPMITTAVVAALTQEYPPDQYGNKSKEGIDWRQVWTGWLTWAVIGVTAGIIAMTVFYLKAHL